MELQERLGDEVTAGPTCLSSNSVMVEGQTDLMDSKYSVPYVKIVRDSFWHWNHIHPLFSQVVNMQEM